MKRASNETGWLSCPLAFRSERRQRASYGADVGTNPADQEPNPDVPPAMTGVDVLTSWSRRVGTVPKGRRYLSLVLGFGGF